MVHAAFVHFLTRNRKRKRWIGTISKLRPSRNILLEITIYTLVTKNQKPSINVMLRPIRIRSAASFDFTIPLTADAMVTNKEPDVIEFTAWASTPLLLPNAGFACPDC